MQHLRRAGPAHVRLAQRACDVQARLPQNLLELSQTLSNLGTLLSDETKRALLPLEIDEAAEAERIAGQRESNMSLFNFSHADEEDGGVDVDGA